MKNLLKMLRTVFRAAPGHAVFGVIATLLTATENVVVGIWLMKFLYDAIAEGMAWRQVVLTLLSIGCLMVLAYGSKYLFEEWLRPAMAARLFEQMHKPIFERSRRLDMQQYDDADFYNDYRWASTEADKRAMEIYNAFLDMESCAVSLAGGLTAILMMDPWVALLAAFYYTASFLLNRRIAKINLARAEELNQPRRRQEYVERVFSSPEYAKDLRMTQIGIPLLKNLRENTKTMLGIQRRYGKQAVRTKSWLSACDALLVDVAIYAYLAWALLVKGNITVGAFVSLASAAEQILWKVGRIVGIVTACAEHAMYAGKYYKFLEALPEMSEGTGSPADGELALRGVTFTYPGTQKPVLSDFDLTIRPGEHIAIVGRNGAGKSTLVKLLLRLYDPDAGSITCGAADARSCEKRAWRQRFGVLFQDFHIFAATLAQNVAMDTQYDAVRVEAALREAGLEVTPQTFPQGLDTMISRQFGEDGTLLSGGQMQKVALARALYVDPAVLILDEPSSALDPIAEYEFNRTLLARLSGRTLVIIAHRLSTVRMMDRIVLIDGERIAEEGSHETLMAGGGLYAQMFEAQRRQYETDGVIT